MKPREDTIVARATPPGTGAVAMVRLSGPQAIPVADKLMKDSLAGKDGHTAHFRILRDDKGVIDESVVTLFRGPHSYTGDDTVEFGLHGSEYIVQRLITALCRHGARPADPGEFTLRAFLNGKLDLAQAEGVADMIAADNEAAHQAAMRQLRGGISADISDIRQRLIHFASLIELELDFSEEDVQFAERHELIQLTSEALEKVNLLLRSFSLGNAMREGVQVVIAGRPNAGKSTLFNQLLNEDRAIVSDIAGTTRDALEDQLAINGLRFRLIDTAGIREATDAIEKLGIERTYRHLAAGTLTLFVFDLSSTTPEGLIADLSQLQAHSARIIAVGNKLDLCGGDKVLQEAAWLGAAQEGGAEDLVCLSGQDAGHREILRELLYQKVVDEGISPDQGLVTTIRHYNALETSRQALERVLQGIHAGISGELLAFDMRAALMALGEITGEITTDDLLDNIFSKFCIGK